jgi:hypothetical protein
MLQVATKLAEPIGTARRHNLVAARPRLPRHLAPMKPVPPVTQALKDPAVRSRPFAAGPGWG